MKILAIAGLAGLLALAGCRSAFVEVKLVNWGIGSVSPVEMDYPGGSFGVAALDGNGTCHFRFKIQGSGETKLMWTDGARRDYSSVGPQLHEGQQGTMTVTIVGKTAEWKTDLR